jgi:hypothetical protein
MGVGAHRHALAALHPGKTRYPLYRRLGGPQGRSGKVRKISPPPGFDRRTFQSVASRNIDCGISNNNNNIQTLNYINYISIHPTIISTESVVTITFQKYLQNSGLTETILREVQIAVLLQTWHTVRKFLGHGLDLKG